MYSNYYCSIQYSWGPWTNNATNKHRWGPTFVMNRKQNESQGTCRFTSEMLKDTSLGHRREVPSTQLIFFLPFWCGRLLSSVTSASTRLSFFYNFSPYRCGITYKIPFQTSPFAENRSGMVRVDLSYHVPLMCTYLEKLIKIVCQSWLTVA